MLRMKIFFYFFNVFKIFVKIFVHSCIMKSTGSVVAYLIFEFSFQHVLFTRICEHSAYTVYENALLIVFSLIY